ncbi:MAG: hypothetical protein MJK04_30530 [Psychrosphaera sp.]|nr:hypothetical protein [Psychrosphaera sp.]
MIDTSNAGTMGNGNVAEEVRALTYSTVLTAWPKVIARVWQIQKQVEIALKNDTAAEIYKLLASSKEDSSVSALIENKDADQIMWQITSEEEERGRNLLMLEAIAKKSDKLSELDKLTESDKITESQKLSELDFTLFSVSLREHNERMILSVVSPTVALRIRTLLCEEVGNSQCTYNKVEDLASTLSFQNDLQWLERLMSYDSNVVLQAFMEEGFILNATADRRCHDWARFFSNQIRVVGFGQSFDYSIEKGGATDGMLGYQIPENINGNGWENVSNLDHTVIFTLPEPPVDPADFAEALADYCTTGKIYVFTC